MLYLKEKLIQRSSFKHTYIRKRIDKVPKTEVEILLKILLYLKENLDIFEK